MFFHVIERGVFSFFFPRQKKTKTKNQNKLPKFKDMQMNPLLFLQSFFSTGKQIM